MTDELLKYKIGISLIPGVGCVNAKKLIAYVGSVEGIFREKKKNLQKIPGVGEHLANAITNQDILSSAEKEIEFIERNNIRFLFYLDKGYPERLKHCADSPVMIFAKGSMELNSKKILSIVGTRSATSYGKEICKDIINDLTEHGQDVVIVSGLAYGIDICAHNTALVNHQPTVGVLAHGLDIVYPSTHTTAAEKMLHHGGLVSEFISNTKLEKANFVKRNRIIAGLADATLVIESGIKGGALITADLANSYNRDVFAVPGKAYDKYSAGCNKLIKTHRAALVENATDIEYLLGWDACKSPSVQQKMLFVEISGEEKVITEILKEEKELGIDLISLKAGFPVSKVSPLLLNLEFKGLVKSLPGKMYALTSAI